VGRRLPRGARSLRSALEPAIGSGRGSGRTRRRFSRPCAEKLSALACGWPCTSTMCTAAMPATTTRRARSAALREELEGVLIARPVAPEPGRSPYGPPGDIRVVDMPHYASAAYGMGVARTVRRALRGWDAGLRAVDVARLGPQGLALPVGAAGARARKTGRARRPPRSPCVRAGQASSAPRARGRRCPRRLLSRLGALRPRRRRRCLSPTY
jgi:hypothetical protein